MENSKVEGRYNVNMHTGLKARCHFKWKVEQFEQDGEVMPSDVRDNLMIRVQSEAVCWASFNSIMRRNMFGEKCLIFPK